MSNISCLINVDNCFALTINLKQYKHLETINIANFALII